MPFVDMSLTLMGVIYVGGGFSLTNWLVFDKAGNYHYDLLLGLLFLTWTNDMGGYVIGKTLGHHKILQSVSPKKTWEGFIGGLFFSFGIGFILSVFIPRLHTLEWMVAALIVSVSGTIGDLSESLLKRALGVKDSGALVPGHGGLLDRNDALLFVFAFCIPLYILFVRQ